MTEQELMAKYKYAGIVDGSHKKRIGKHKGKYTVRCKCKACGKISPPIASSDLWQKVCKCGQKFNGRKTRAR